MLSEISDKESCADSEKLVLSETLQIREISSRLEDSATPDR